jgi:glycosyltransferase involved in cell wall biosynthesis
MSDNGVIFIAAGTDHVRAANLAAQSVRELTPSLMVDLFTDVPDIADQTLFDQIHWIEDPHVRSKVDYIHRTRFARTLYMDTDIRVVADISEMFEVLDRFDIALAHAHARNRPETTEVWSIQIPDAFPQMNGGVILFRATPPVLELMREWQAAYHRAGFSKDQVTLRELIWLSDLRLHILPPEYNLRYEKYLSVWRPREAVPRILHFERFKYKPKMTRKKQHGQSENPEEDLQYGFRNPRRGGQPVGAAGLVSVVIPCYNQAHFLGEAIESVLAQSYPRFEIIVVDDGSTDDTSEVAARYPGVRYVYQNNQGVSAARNSGLARSEGEYVVFLDADDRLLPEALEAGLECLKTHSGCAFASGRYRFIAGDGSFLKPQRRRFVDKDSYVALLRRNYIGPPAAVMYRRAVFESVGGFDPPADMSADTDIYLRIASRFPICRHEEEVAEYRWHGANTSGDPARMLSTALYVLRKQREHVRGNEQYQEAYDAGVRGRQGAFGDRLVDEVRAHAREREWKRALRGMVVLLRHYPRGIALLNERRMKRHRFPRRLEARRQELKAHQRWLKELEGAEESGSALVAKERQKVQLLRRRVRRLERRIQGLDQRARILQGGMIRRLLKEFGGLRARVPRKKRGS